MVDKQSTSSKRNSYAHKATNMTGPLELISILPTLSWAVLKWKRNLQGVAEIGRWSSEGLLTCIRHRRRDAWVHVPQSISLLLSLHSSQNSCSSDQWMTRMIWKSGYLWHSAHTHSRSWVWLICWNYRGMWRVSELSCCSYSIPFQSLSSSLLLLILSIYLSYHTFTSQYSDKGFAGSFRFVSLDFGLGKGSKQASKRVEQRGRDGE